MYRTHIISMMVKGSKDFYVVFVFKRYLRKISLVTKHFCKKKFFFNIFFDFVRDTDNERFSYRHF